MRAPGGPSRCNRSGAAWWAAAGCAHTSGCSALAAAASAATPGTPVPHPCLVFSQPAQRRAAAGRAVCRHRSALVEHIDLLAPHHALLAAHSEQLVPRLQAICPHLPDLPLPDLLGRIDALGAPASRSFDGPFSLAANRIMLSWCRPRNAGPRLDQLLDAMSPSLQLFLPHVLQHVDTLGPHLALLIDSLDDLGAHTLSKQLFVAHAPGLSPRCARSAARQLAARGGRAAGRRAAGVRRRARRRRFRGAGGRGVRRRRAQMRLRGACTTRFPPCLYEHTYMRRQKPRGGSSV